MRDYTVKFRYDGTDKELHIGTYSAEDPKFAVDQAMEDVKNNESLIAEGRPIGQFAGGAFIVDI